MKKLVYILSFAIGLILTGCEKSDDFASLAPDTWGPVAELTLEMPDTLTSDVLDIKIVTKYATNVSFVVATSPADVDYTALLKGQYGGIQYEPEVEAEDEAYTFEIQMPGVEAGQTYYLYAVAINAAGVQTKANKAMGAVDVTAPAITSNPQLTAGDKGRRVTVAFNEPVLRDDSMGAIEYKAYTLDVDNGVAALAFTGTDVTASAAGSNLTVNLPVEFDPAQYYIVTLSFAEGAVTDHAGNKMAAVVATFDESTLEVTNGYWWLKEPESDTPVDDTKFFNNGTYYFYALYTDETDGNQYEANVPFEMNKVADGYDMSKVFGDQLAGVYGEEWMVSGLLSNMFQDVTDQDFPALVYNYSDANGTAQFCTLVDYNDANGYTCIGSANIEGKSYPAYIAAVDMSAGSLMCYWDFFLADENGNSEAPVSDLFGFWAFPQQYTPAIAVYGDLGKGESFYILMAFDGILLTREGAQAQGAVRYEQPVKVDNVLTQQVLARDNKVLLNK